MVPEKIAPILHPPCETRTITIGMKKYEGDGKDNNKENNNDVSDEQQRT